MIEESVLISEVSGFLEVVMVTNRAFGTVKCVLHGKCVLVSGCLDWRVSSYPTVPITFSNALA